MHRGLIALFVSASLVSVTPSARADDGITITEEPSSPMPTEEQKANMYERLERAQEAEDDRRAEEHRRDEEQSMQYGPEPERSADDSSEDSDEGVDESSIGLGWWLLAGAAAMVAVPVIANWLHQEPAQPQPPGRSAAPAGVAAAAATPSPPPPSSLQEIALFLLIFAALSMLATVLGLVCTWRLFSKAGRPGWAAIVPLYNWWVFLEIGGLPGWLILIPLVNGLATAFIVPFGLAQRFGRSIAFAFGLVLAGPVFYPVLAFGASKYAARPATG